MLFVRGNEKYTTAKEKLTLGNTKHSLYSHTITFLKISIMLTDGSIFPQPYIPYWLILVVGSGFKIMRRAWVNSQREARITVISFSDFTGTIWPG